LKIAYFINQYPKVTHTFIRREIQALERLGFEVQRLALRGWSEALPDPQDVEERARTRYVLRHGFAGLMLPTLRVGLSSPLKLLRALQLALRLSRRGDHRLHYHLIRVAEACAIVPLMRADGAVRLHAHFGTNSAEVALYARCLGGPPYSLTIHGPEEFESPMGLAEKVHAAAFVAAISSYGRAQLYLRCDTRDWAKIQVVHCGVEPAFQQTTAVAPPESPRLVCVGRLCEAKGQLLLVEAAAQLRERGVACELVLAGDGPLRAELDAAIAHHGLSDAVRITGWIRSEAVRDEILAARALVLPSFAEGLPVVIMEAMALHRPVLSTFVAGIPELVRHGENGWLFPAGSVHELAAAMQDCLARPPAEIRRMGEAAFARVTERHSIDVEAAKLAALFSQRP
jgi:colanic acid/amylovoran biosynthesis glycosyltransferase